MDDADGPAEAVPRSAVRLRPPGPPERRTLAVAAEAPLEIRVGRIAVAVVMRTPGADLDLARGFLLTEGIVRDPAQIRAVRHCDRLEPGHEPDNVVVCTLDPSAPFDPARFRRNLYATSSCGICGKASLERALATAPPLSGDGPAVPAPKVLAALAAMADRQPLFAATGGVHAAAVADARGVLACVREDVGRHNAVDKVVGATVCRPGRLDTAPAVLLVSGRISFEVVQKALAARIPAVAGISAPTSLAVDLAHGAGIGLAGFARGETMEVYAHPERFGLPVGRARAIKSG